MRCIASPVATAHRPVGGEDEFPPLHIRSSQPALPESRQVCRDFLVRADRQVGTLFQARCGAEEDSFGVLQGPGGAAGCSHGWSGVRRQTDGAEPVEEIAFYPFCPGGAEESLNRAAEGVVRRVLQCPSRGTLNRDDMIHGFCDAVHRFTRGYSPLPLLGHTADSDGTAASRTRTSHRIPRRERGATSATRI